MREILDTKGGGLLILWEKNTYINIKKLKSGHSDVLYATAEINTFAFKIILAYVAVNDTMRNNKTTKCIDKILTEN